MTLTQLIGNDLVYIGVITAVLVAFAIVVSSTWIIRENESGLVIKKYGPALDAFAGFLMKYPDHPYAANAMYWRGECYFAQGEYLRAIEQFEGVVARFPLGGKTPDALLKLGISQQKLGNPTKAKEYFDKLGREWPRSDAVRHIPEKP